MSLCLRVKLLKHKIQGGNILAIIFSVAVNFFFDDYSSFTSHFLSNLLLIGRYITIQLENYEFGTLKVYRECCNVCAGEANQWATIRRRTLNTGLFFQLCCLLL